jgi:hypothetical protein
LLINDVIQVMLPAIKGSKSMNSWIELEVIKQTLVTSPKLDVKIKGQCLIVTRRRLLVPRHGFFRLAIPHARAIVTSGIKGLTLSVQPDPIAIFVVLIILGGVAGELFTDRVKYPRDYPPEAIYGFSIFYIGLLIVEMIRTRRQVRALLNSALVLRQK